LKNDVCGNHGEGCFVLFVDSKPFHEPFLCTDVMESSKLRLLGIYYVNNHVVVVFVSVNW